MCARCSVGQGTRFAALRLAANLGALGMGSQSPSPSWAAEITPGQGAEPRCVVFRASLDRTAGMRGHFGIATFVCEAAVAVTEVN